MIDSVAVDALRAQRLVAHDFGARGQCLRHVACRAGQLHVAGIELEARSSLVVETQLVEAACRVVAVGATLGTAVIELTCVRIAVTVLAIAAADVPECSSRGAGLGAGRVASDAGSLLVRAGQCKARPDAVVEVRGTRAGEGLLRVAARATG